MGTLSIKDRPPFLLWFQLRMGSTVWHVRARAKDSACHLMVFDCEDRCGSAHVVCISLGRGGNERMPVKVRPFNLLGLFRAERKSMEMEL